MKRKHLILSLILALVPVACDDDDGDSDTGNDSATDSGNDSATGSGNDSATGSADSATSSSMETCNSSHQCINGACECTTPGMEGMSCTDDVACEDECEVCM